MKVLGIIPARYASTRFPGKPLIDILGKTMIQRVYEQARKSNSLSKVIVATDDERIYNHVRRFGDVIITSTEHPSGTDRCLEACQNLSETYDVVINIQGDEPLLDPEQLNVLAESFSDQSVQIATLATIFKSEELLFDTSKVKVILNQRGNALYFSRQCIPFQQKEHDQWMTNYNYLQHVGIYAFRSNILAEVAKLPQSTLEKAESLEQLRWLDNGYAIRVELCDHNGISVDVPEDLNRVIDLLNKA